MKNILVLLLLIPAVSISGEITEFGLLANKLKKAHLFDLSHRVFPVNGPEERVKYENEFIELGKYYEKNQFEFIRHIIETKFDLNNENFDLSEFKNDYYFDLQIPNIFFEDYDNFKEMDKWTIDDLPVAYLYKKTDRSEKNLERLWTNYSDDILGLLTVPLESESTQLKIVNALLTTYEYITGLEDYKKTLKSILRRLEDENPEPNDMIDYMDPILCPDIVREFARESSYYKWLDVQWLHSFWIRRYEEGNMDVYVKILKILQS